LAKAMTVMSGLDPGQREAMGSQSTRIIGRYSLPMWANEVVTIAGYTSASN